VNLFLLKFFLNFEDLRQFIHKLTRIFFAYKYVDRLFASCLYLHVATRLSYGIVFCYGDISKSTFLFTRIIFNSIYKIFTLLIKVLVFAVSVYVSG